MGERFLNGTLLLEENDIVKLINKIGLEKFLRLLIERLEKGFADFAKGEITVPVRHEFFFEKGSMESMPAADKNYFGVKLVNTHPENPSVYQIPTIIASGVLVDGKTGYPLLLTESTILTALRTATASAIATKYLARNNAKVIGIIGTGAQSLAQLHAISLVRDVEKVFAFDIDSKALQDFKEAAERLGFKVELTDSETLCRNSDILVTTTCKKKDTPPVVYNSWINDGSHINAVGGDSPRKTELEKELVLRSKLTVDFIDQATYEGEAQQVSKNKIYAHLGEIVAGIKQGRTGNEITIFDSVGFAMEDLITYQLVYELAMKENIGKRIKIVAKPKYPKNLYSSYFVINDKVKD